MRFPKLFRRSTSSSAPPAGAEPTFEVPMSSGMNWLAKTSGSPRLMGSILALSLVAVGATVYLTPTGNDKGKSELRTAAPNPSTQSPRPAPTITITADAAAEDDPANPTKITRPEVKTVVVRSTVAATPSAPKPLYCSQFAWQQDAQAAYEANLSDPWGLDGAAGPNNGDGLACTILPIDPARPESTPVGAYVPPAVTAASRTALVSPDLNYFGVSQDGLPNSTPQFNALSVKFGKAPSSVGYFQYWNQPFDPTKVQTAWSRGSLPVMTWMSKPSDGSSDVPYNLTAINNGDWDTYLYKYAGDVRKLNLPVVIRFDHEMNGNWYPWSAGKYSDPQAYVKAWKHVWNIFQAVGANEDVIWLWSPGRIDNVSGTGTTQLGADYPGDNYVDWVGATVYWRNQNVATDFNTSFKKTIDKIRTLTNKPLFFAEVGALGTSPTGADLTTQKVQWIQNMTAGFLANPSIIGFNWFDNIATTADDPNNPHDWRIESTPTTLAAFAAAIADPRFKSGTLPDGH